MTNRSTADRSTPNILAYNQFIRMELTRKAISVRTLANELFITRRGAQMKLNGHRRFNSEETHLINRLLYPGADQ